MGGSTKSTSKTDSSTNYDVKYDTSIYTEDRRIGASDNAIVAAEGSNVHVERVDVQLVERALAQLTGLSAAISADANKTTRHTVEEAFDFATEHTEQQAELTKYAYGQAGDVQAGALELVGAVLERQQPTLEGLRSFLTATTVIAGVGFAAWAYSKAGK